MRATCWYDRRRRPMRAPLLNYRRPEMPVTAEARGRVLVVAMDRPHKRNAIDADISAGIDAALNRLDDDPELWVGILTGTDSLFSAGTDLRSGAGAGSERRRVRPHPAPASQAADRRRGGHRVRRRLRDRPPAGPDADGETAQSLEESSGVNVARTTPRTAGYSPARPTWQMPSLLRAAQGSWGHGVRARPDAVPPPPACLPRDLTAAQVRTKLQRICQMSSSRPSPARLHARARH